MKIKLLGLLGIAFVLLSSFAFAQENTVINPEVTSTKYLGEAEQKYIDLAIDYIKERLGQDYYNQYVAFDIAGSYEDCSSKCLIRNEISFDYKIPFDESSESISPPKIRVTLNSDGDITLYNGPVKPYKFLITQERAIEIAKEKGVQTANGAQLLPSLLEENGYELVWAVSSEDIIGYGEFAKEPLYKGVYIDVETGDIKGEYLINPLIQTPVDVGGIGLGNFYDDQDALDGSNNLWVILISVLIGLIVVFFIYRTLRK